MQFMIGYQLQQSGKLIEEILRSKEHIYEVYFAWGGMPSGRGAVSQGEDLLPHEALQSQQQQLQQLHEAGIRLNLLLNAGAPSDAVADNGDTLLHILVHNYDDESKFIVKQLIVDGIPCDVQDGEGQTLLHIACIKQLRDLIHYLIAKDVRINVTDKKGKTPLFYANKGDDYVIVQFLKDKGAK